MFLPKTNINWHLTSQVFPPNRATFGLRTSTRQAPRCSGPNRRIPARISFTTNCIGTIRTPMRRITSMCIFLYLLLRLHLNFKARCVVIIKHFFFHKSTRRIANTESYDLTGLYPDTIYYVWLAARSQRGEGATTPPIPVLTKQHGKQKQTMSTISKKKLG